MTVMLLQNNVCAYSSNNNSVSKSGPSTIEDQYRHHVNKNGPSENEGRPRLNVFSLPHTGGNKRQGKAMNYYRLWIYTCNAVLLLSVLGFIIVAGRVVVTDPRRHLVPGLRLSEPSLVYGYMALVFQSGLLQLLGCIGAHKLNEKLLNTYWLLLICLLFGDAVVGIVWIFRFDQIYTDLKPILKQKLQTEYGVNEEFTNLWDSVQRDFRCCGVEGPQDFNEIDLSRKPGKKNNETRGRNYPNGKRDEKSAENDRNRVIFDRMLNLSSRDYAKGFATGSTTNTDDNLTDGAKEVDFANSFLSTLVTMSSLSESITKEPNVKYVRNVPESCCRTIAEDVPDENRIEEHEESPSKPTAIRQRLEKKKNRYQEKKPSKREAEEDFRQFEVYKWATTPAIEVSCKGLKSCKNSNKRHILDREMQFRSSHVRHDLLNKNSHHYSASANAAVAINATHEKKYKEPKYSTGNTRIMETCANVNGHPIGTVYGMSETLHFSVGCEVKLKNWLRDSAHVLGVLGYCVIAFLKLCFIGILRYEIREMIQKIKMLQGELQPPVLLLSTDSPVDNPEVSPTSPHNICNHMDNSTLVSSLNKGPQTPVQSEGTLRENPDRLRANSLGNAFLLLQSHDSGQTTPVHQIKTIQMTQQNHRLYNNLLGGDPGNDSDTNSHCALLIDGGDEAAPTTPAPHKKKHTRVSSNGNNNYESHELQDLLVRRSAQI